MRLHLVALVSTILGGAGCIGFHHAPPVPLAALSSSQLIVTDELFRPDGRHATVDREGSALAISTGDRCPAVSGDLTATLNGAPLALKKRGGEDAASFGPFAVANCQWLVFQTDGARLPLDQPIEIVVSDGVTTIRASFPAFVIHAQAAVEPAHVKDGAPLVANGETYELVWAADAPFIAAVQATPSVRLRGLSALHATSCPSCNDADFAGAHDRVRRATRFTPKPWDDGDQERLRGKGSLAVHLVAQYPVDEAMGFQPVTHCSGVASCSVLKKAYVEANLAARVVAELPAGSDGGKCYGNATCDAGLACTAGLCVRAP